MIKMNAITPGQTIVRDPEASGVPSRQWFRITSKTEEKAVGENLGSRSTKVFTASDLRRLEPARDTPFCEIDLSALLGQRVQIDLAHGKNVGVVTEIVTRSTVIFGTSIDVPVGIAIDGDIIRWPEIRNVIPA